MRIAPLRRFPPRPPFLTTPVLLTLLPKEEASDAASVEPVMKGRCRYMPDDSDAIEQWRGQLVSMLQERGLDEFTALRLLDNHSCNSVEGSIHLWDDKRGDKSSGLLIYFIENEKGRFYKAPEKRRLTSGGGPTAALIRNIRMALYSPNGISRVDARHVYARKAKALGLGVDALIDLAMGEAWAVTPVHGDYERRKGESPEEYRERWHQIVAGPEDEPVGAPVTMAEFENDEDF